MIHSLTWAELQAYDVGRLKPGTAYAKSFPDQQPVDGTRIPRLSDLFDLVKRSGDERVRFDIETKLSPDAPDETPAPEAFWLTDTRSVGLSLPVRSACSTM